MSVAHPTDLVELDDLVEDLVFVLIRWVLVLDDVGEGEEKVVFCLGFGDGGELEEFVEDGGGVEDELGVEVVD